MLGPAVEEGQQHRSCEALKPAQPWPLSQVIEKMEQILEERLHERKEPAPSNRPQGKPIMDAFAPQGRSE